MNAAHPCCSKCGEVIGDWELNNVSRERRRGSELELKLTRNLVNGIPRLSQLLLQLTKDA